MFVRYLATSKNVQKRSPTAPQEKRLELEGKTIPQSGTNLAIHNAAGAGIIHIFKRLCRSAAGHRAPGIASSLAGRYSPSGEILVQLFTGTSPAFNFLGDWQPVAVLRRAGRRGGSSTVQNTRIASNATPASMSWRILGFSPCPDGGAVAHVSGAGTSACTGSPKAFAEVVTVMSVAASPNARP